MAGSFTKNTIENIKNRIDIVDVVGNVVQLKKSGSNFKGVCPFHNEKTPSFVVSEEKQIFTCFGCGESGDVISFVEKFYNMDFSDAVEKLASDYNIPVERNKGGYSENLQPYYDINKEAATFFLRAFTESANRGYAYMKGRDISDRILKRFGVGYADGEWNSLYNHLKEKGYSEQLMLRAGLISESKGRYYDKFRNRVMFPIIDTHRKVIGFGGRAIEKDQMPKYLNSPENPVFKKKNNLYGLNIARQSINNEKRLIIVEGYMDTIALAQGGIDNVSATLGTALTENQAALIKRYTKDVVLSYDADEAGRNAALRGIEILKGAGCKVKVLHVTDGKDPDEYVKKNGKVAFMDLVEKALSYEEYRIESAKRKYDLSNEEEKIDCLKEVAAILKSFSPVEQDIYIKKTASELNVSENALRLEVEGSRLLPGDDFKRPAPKIRRPVQVTEMSQAEKELIRTVIHNPDYAERIEKEAPDIFIDETAKYIYREVKIEADKAGVDFRLENLLQRFDENTATVTENIVKNVPVGGDEENIYRDCLKRLRLMHLEEEERILIEQLAIGESCDDTDSIDFRETMLKLKDIQQNIQIIKNTRE